MNQRATPRKPFVEMVTVISARGKKFVSRSDNLSTGGIFIQDDEPMSVGEHGLVSVVYDGAVHKQEIHCKFEVTHTQTTASGMTGMGLRFLDLSAAEADMLRQNLESTDDVVAT